MSPEESGAIEALIPNLRRYARVLVRDPDLADDLVQDCLERAIARYDRFTPGTNLRSWLFTILLNLVRSQARSNKRRGVVVSLDEIRNRAISEAVQERPLVLRDLQNAFDQLPPSFQEVVLFVAVEGLSYEEAAEIIGVPVGTVRSRLSRAREQMRQSMQEHGPAEVARESAAEAPERVLRQRESARFALAAAG